MAEFDSCLDSEVIDLEFLREQSYRGIPEGGGRRATSWRILLGFLPVKRKLWGEVCQSKRDLYKQLVGEMSGVCWFPIPHGHPPGDIFCILGYKSLLKCFDRGY